MTALLLIAATLCHFGRRASASKKNRERWSVWMMCCLELALVVGIAVDGVVIVWYSRRNG